MTISESNERTNEIKVEKITQPTQLIHAVELSVNLYLEFNLTKRKIIFGKNE